MDNNTQQTTNAPATSPAPAPVQHQNLFAFLQILLHVAPAIAAPFVKNPGTAAVLNAEVPILETLGDAAIAAASGSAQ